MKNKEEKNVITLGYLAMKKAIMKGMSLQFACFPTDETCGWIKNTCQLHTKAICDIVAHFFFKKI